MMMMMMTASSFCSQFLFSMKKLLIRTRAYAINHTLTQHSHLFYVYVCILYMYIFFLLTVLLLPTMI